MTIIIGKMKPTRACALRGIRQIVNHVCSYQDNGYFQAVACAGPGELFELCGAVNK